jgi:hypothetical protein
VGLTTHGGCFAIGCNRLSLAADSAGKFPPVCGEAELLGSEGGFHPADIDSESSSVEGNAAGLQPRRLSDPFLCGTRGTPPVIPSQYVTVRSGRLGGRDKLTVLYKKETLAMFRCR